jgi:mRNA interferase HigB
VRIIRIPFLVDVIRRFPKSKRWIENWSSIAKKAEWKNIVEVRTSYPSADPVAVKSGKTVVIFNVCGNDYRLITAIHYNRGIIYTLRFMTHAEYSKNKWKQEL